MGSPENEIDALKKQIAALTGRVYQLEQKTGEGLGERSELNPQAQPQTAAPPPAGTMFQTPQGQTVPGMRPAGQMREAQLPSIPLAASTRAGGDFEKRIGEYWLNRIGIIAMLIGVSYFLKYAFDNNWIGASGRIAIGLLAGIGLILWSEGFRARGHKAFSYSLKAVGIGTLYLSLWGAFQVYHLISATAAFLAMAVVTAATIVMALAEDAELLASFALIGGFATPVLLSAGENHEVRS